MKKLIWTAKKPTEIGWYWKRYSGEQRKRWGEEKCIVYIRDYVGKLCIQNWEIPTENIEWAGPIPYPKEEK